MNGLIRWRPQFPFRPWGRFWEDEWEDLFEDFEDLMEPSWMVTEGFRPFRVPRLETYHKEGNYIIKADLPGVNPNDLRVTVEGDHLVIQGERRFDEEMKRGDFRRREIFYGSFRRAIPIPKGLKVEGMKAHYHDGILEISAPMDEKFLPKVIKVEVEQPERELQKAA